jgi:hypothetical protein
VGFSEPRASTGGPSLEEEAIIGSSRARVLILTLLLAGVGWSQEARVSGRVTDKTGAVVPDAKVAITNTETGIAHDTKTNDPGYRL